MKALKMTKPDSTEMDMNTVALRFKLIQTEIESLEKVLKGYRATLEAAALKHENHTLETEDFVVKVFAATRESVSLHELRKKLNSKVLAMISPLIKITKYNQVKVVQRGKVAA